MELVDKQISLGKLRQMAENGFGNLVKAVVDVKKEIMVVDTELHSDEEGHLMSLGSRQEDLWGINFYPELKGKEFIEFDSMINLRPSHGNNSRGVDDPQIRKRITEIVENLVTE